MDSYTLKAVLSAVDRLSPVLKSVQGVAKNTRKYLGDVGTSLSGMTAKLGVPLGILSGVAAGLGVVGVKNAVVSFTELGEAIKNGAVKAGMSTDEFQRMRFVAEQASLDVDTFGAAMGKLNKGLGAAAMGKNDGLAGLMKGLKIPLKDANGQMRSAAELLPQIAEVFRQNEDPIQRAALGTALFGKSYQELLPLLVDGRKGIDESLSNFAKFKALIPQEELDRAEAFGDRLAILSVVGGEFVQVIGGKLVPVLEPLIESLLTWVAVNRELISGALKDMVTDLAEAIKSVDWQGFLQGVRGSFAALGGAVDAVGGLKNALIILAVVMNAQTILAVGGLIGALVRLGWVAGVATFGKLGLLAKANIWLGTSFAWLRMRAIATVLALQIGGVAGMWGSLGVAISSAGAAIAAMGAWLLGAGKAALLFSRALLLSPLGILLGIAAAAYLIYTNWSAITAYLARVGPAWAELWSDMKAEVISGIASVGATLSAWSPLPWITNAWGRMGAAVGEKWQQLTDVVTSGVALVDGLLTAWSPLEWIANAWDPVLGYFKSLWDSVRGFMAPLLQAVGVDGMQPGVAAPGGQGGVGGGGLGAQTLNNFNLNASPPQANLNSSVEINFKNAPPGMRVERSSSNSPRMAVNTNVGTRSLGTDSVL